MKSTIFGYEVQLRVKVPDDHGSGYRWVEVEDGIKLDTDRSDAIVNLTALLDAVQPPCPLCGTKKGHLRK